jgi:Kef-type K+ transport system membrane component KefB
LLSQLLLALALVIALGQLVGHLFRRVGQPPVIGEVVAGILLGPSLLGWLWPDAYAFVLPASVVPLLGAVAQLGVILYMFLVGLELNPERLRGRLGATVAIAQANILIPFALGVVLAFWLERFSSTAVPFVSFALFVGVAMAITAFPVLARILSDRGLTRTELGSVALSTAAISDVSAWCLLAFVVGVVQPDSSSAFGVAALTLAFFAVMFAAVRPLMSRMEGTQVPNARTVALVLAGLLTAAWTSEVIGVHAIFGAFIFGAVIPHDSKLATALHSSFEHLVTILLLPAFFAFTGMKTEIGQLSSVDDWAVCAAIVGVATVGKFGGTFVAARLAGFDTRLSASLGVLMNTRGLMELIVLNVGLELGVISPRLFTMFVIMALVTTIATTPIMRTLAGPTSPGT